MATASMRKVAFAATAGTMIEWYDFFVYGTAAALVFNKQFFPQVDPLVGTLLAFGTSATGFFARPVGALVAGHYGDRVGRKALLMTTLLLMGSATFLIGCLPTYAVIGTAAPVALLSLRLIQGFAAGGEWGGAALMTVEHASASRRGLWGSLITVGILLGLVLASLVFILMSGLPEESFQAWGWRVPFLVSALLVALGLYMRLAVPESPEFEAVLESGVKEERPIVAALREWRSILAIFLIRIAENFGFYTFSAFSLAYVSNVLGMPRYVILNAVTIAAAVECVTAVLFGACADRVGGRRVLMLGLAFQAALAFPFFWLLELRSPAMVVLAVTLGLAVANGAISAVQPDYFSGFFSANVRYSGISLGRESATVVGAGVGPVVATALVSWSAGSWPVSLCILGTSLIGLLVVAVVNRPGSAALLAPAPRAAIV